MEKHQEDPGDGTRKQQGPGRSTKEQERPEQAGMARTQPCISLPVHSACSKLSKGTVKKKVSCADLSVCLLCAKHETLAFFVARQPCLVISSLQSKVNNIRLCFSYSWLQYIFQIEFQTLNKNESVAFDMYRNFQGGKNTASIKTKEFKTEPLIIRKNNMTN